MIDIKKPYPVNLKSGDAETKKIEILNYFHETYDAYESLFHTLIDNKAYTTRADPLRHPLIFYYGHTAVFLVNKLVLAKLLPKRINPEFENIFAIGVDEMSWDDLNESHYKWPSPDEVKSYRNEVRQKIDDLISELTLEFPIDWDSSFWPILMGIEHERIHLETSAVLIRQLPLHLLDQNSKIWPTCKTDNPIESNKLLPVPGGTIELGKSEDDGYYGWDNEYGKLEANIDDFSASKYLVSNNEFLEFIKEKGYTTQRYWTEEGWNWVCFEKTQSPRFWRKQKDGSYKLRTMLNEIDMPWSWPVETNYLEAKAFCNWKSEKTGTPIRLPSEEEWHKLLKHTELKPFSNWKNNAPGNINLEGHASCVPVDTHEFKHGFYDIIGNVWQHTETPIRGYPGFKVHPLYDDFSTPTFDTKHNLIKGGSWISSGNEMMFESRYAFRRHFYQFAGIRYIKTEAPVVIPDDSWETDPEIIPYCDFNYGKPYFNSQNFPEQLAKLCLDNITEKSCNKALVLGCKTGRSVFELAQKYQHVTGIDLSARMIQVGAQMIEKGYTQFILPDEGEIVSFHQANLKDFDLDHTRPKVDFMQGDISNLKSIYNGYDLILIDTMLENTYAPKRILETIHQRLTSNGTLIIACTNDWNEQKTPKMEWIGGYKAENGENMTTIDGLEEILSKNFNHIKTPIELKSILRKTKRTFNQSIIQVSFWQKN